MIRLLPFILIPILIVSGLGIWRYAVTRQNLTTSSSGEANQQTQETGLVEVPKTLPGATIEDRVKGLEDIITKLTPQVNSLKSVGTSGAPSSLDSRVTALETAVADLKTRVITLEQATPAPAAASSTKYPLYIPLGSGGGPWGDQTWNTLAEYQVSINPDNYPDYSSMQLEANFRLTESAGTGSVRLYNVTDSSSIASQLDTISTSFGTQTSSKFKLPSGQKTYTIQVQTTQGKTLFVQSARIKVNF